jgi:hypothetical protein
MTEIRGLEGFGEIADIKKPHTMARLSQRRLN